VTETPLDVAALHVVRDGQLEYRGGDRWSPAHDALSAALRVSGDRVGLALDDGSTLDVSGLGYRLSPFELRYAADHGRLHPIPFAARTTEKVRTPTTDLHTHYAGCVSGADLVEIGQAITMSSALLADAGVHIDASAARIGDLPEGARSRLASSLSVPIDKRITFVDMERIYRLRGAITKSDLTFAAILRRLALDYAAMGIRYVELSLGTLVEARVLRAIHASVPAIEEETGVTMRFLLALSRHDDPEWDEDLLRRLATLDASLYVVGIDVMGHETNSTRAFVPQLRTAAAWAHAARPGFVIRVHAGESPSHPENVRVAIEATSGFDVQLRIGHGLYGVDDATLEALVRERTIVEMNLDSNVALNHIANGREAPIRRYLDAGARIVLGSDGYGIYGASAHSAMRAALVSGMRAADLEGPLARVEEEVLADAKRRDAKASHHFVVPDDLAPVAYTPAVAERRRQATLARDAALRERLSAQNIPLLSRAELDALCAGRKVVSVAGAWLRSWEAMTDAERTRVRTELAAFVDALDPKEVVLITGGTRFGTEGPLGERAVARGIVVIGAIVSETKPALLEAGTITHAHIVASTLYEKGARLYELVSALGGSCVFVGGGQIVRDEIQAAKNLGLPYVAMTEIGASGAHARERPTAAFHTGAEAAYFIAARETRIAPHWFVGPNPTVDAIVIRDGRELLLIRRSPEAPVAPGAWALPGGFVATHAERGGEWKTGRETPEEACIRELREETAVAITFDRLRRVGVFEGNGRDPRDGPRSFSRTTAFLVELARDEATALAGGDDAEDARWFPLDALPTRLAFDHAEIIRAALARARA
jgi:ADP-ribose pyrophosphatase YjhB (NUDIX family)